ncbi:MAG: hypothetical protein SGPRY_010278 [Prymnesium sp.]
MAPEVEEAKPYGLPADVFSFGALAFEMFYILDTGEWLHIYMSARVAYALDCTSCKFIGWEDFYEGMNLFTGLETLRAPLTMQPQQWPDRPASCADEGELPTMPTLRITPSSAVFHPTAWDQE